MDRHLSAIHYRLPNDSLSTLLIKCCGTVLSTTGDFSQCLTPQFFTFIICHSAGQTAEDKKLQSAPESIGSYINAMKQSNPELLHIMLCQNMDSELLFREERDN